MSNMDGTPKRRWRPYVKFSSAEEYEEVRELVRRRLEVVSPTEKEKYAALENLKRKLG